MAHPLYRLAESSSAHLASQNYSCDRDTLLAQKFANGLDAAIAAPLPEREFTTKEVRGLRHAPTVLSAEIASPLSALFNAATDSFNQVRWTEFYQQDAWSEKFLDEFANGEGIGPDGTLYHQEIILGLFVLGPDTVYPEHAHPAEEFYIVLTGNPEFKVGVDNDFVGRKPGDVILHHSDVSHSIRTSQEPFFGIFGWRGDIHALSWYRDDMTNFEEKIKHPFICKE